MHIKAYHGEEDAAGLVITSVRKVVTSACDLLYYIADLFVVSYKVTTVLVNELLR